MYDVLGTLMSRRSITTTCVLLWFVFQCNAQSFRDITVHPSDEGKILLDFLHEQEVNQGIDFICREEKMRSYTLTGIAEMQRFSDYLDHHFANLKVVKYSDKAIFIVDKSLADDVLKENFLLFRKGTGEDFVLRGAVKDTQTNDPLISAKVYLPALQTGIVSDENGRFKMKMAADDIIQCDVQYVGYEPTRYVIGFSRFGTLEELDAMLVPQSRELQSVTITAERVDENVTAKITGVEKLSISAIKTVPAFLGEVDPIRSLSTLPGVTTPGELASGFNVRGGEAGQNLVLQDGAIIYNPSHLFGFFSAFNPDMVSNVTLYKGGGPANYGGRISSVLDVSLRNGDSGKHTVSGGIGMVSSRLTVEGPIVRNKSSYLLSGRFSYCNWLVRATDNISLQNSKANFYDFTGKIFHTINQNNLITISAYNSYDDFKLATDSVFAWRTTNVSLKWDHTFREDLFSTLTAVNSNYTNQVQSISPIEGFVYENSIRDLGFNYNLTRVLSEESKVVAGLDVTGTLIDPGKLMPADNFGNVTASDMQDQRSVESSVFFQWDQNVSANWSLSAGLRFGYFMRLGEENIFMFDDNEMNGRYPSINDTIAYDRGEVIRRYSGLEPRVSVSYLISKQSSLKASYYRGFQYLHLISNTSSSTPQDYWVTSGPYLKPEIGDQYSLGFFRNTRNQLYEFSLEGFYKVITNAVDYIEGADITLNPSLEAGLVQGKGLAYGAEAFIKKRSGRISGWLAYTYSRSLRRFASQEGGRTINGGDYYPSSFDQPHHISLVLNYQFSPRCALSTNFVYSTGRPITIPVSKFSYDAYLSVLEYSDRNDYRIDDYHRLDLSLTIKDRQKKNKRLTGEWVISLFNVYGRKNTYSVMFNRYGTASKMSVIGTIFPSVSYNFHF
jgi:hypothetical protein